MYFCFCCLCLGCHIQKIISKTRVERSNPCRSGPQRGTEFGGSNVTEIRLPLWHLVEKWRIVGIQSWGSGFFQGIMGRRGYSSRHWGEDWHLPLQSSFSTRFAIWKSYEIDINSREGSLPFSILIKLKDEK